MLCLGLLDTNYGSMETVAFIEYYDDWCSSIHGVRQPGQGTEQIKIFKHGESTQAASASVYGRGGASSRVTGVAVSCPNLYRGAPTHLLTGYTPLTEPQSAVPS